MTSYNRVNESDNYLMHWKYIKKVRRNGKWVYYYDKKKLKDDLSDAKEKVEDALGITAKREAENAENELASRRTLSELAKEQLDTHTRRANSDRVVDKYEQRHIDDAAKINEGAYQRYLNAAGNWVKANDKFLNTPLGKLETAMQKGKSFLKKIFGR